MNGFLRAFLVFLAFVFAVAARSIYLDTLHLTLLEQGDYLSIFLSRWLSQLVLLGFVVWVWFATKRDFSKQAGDTTTMRPNGASTKSSESFVSATKLPYRLRVSHAILAAAAVVLIAYSIMYVPVPASVPTSNRTAPTYFPTPPAPRQPVQPTPIVSSAPLIQPGAIEPDSEPESENDQTTRLLELGGWMLDQANPYQAELHESFARLAQGNYTSSTVLSNRSSILAGLSQISETREALKAYDLKFQSLANETATKLDGIFESKDDRDFYRNELLKSVIEPTSASLTNQQGLLDDLEALLRFMIQVQDQIQVENGQILFRTQKELDLYNNYIQSIHDRAIQEDNLRVQVPQ